MASLSSKTDQQVTEKLEEIKEVDDTKLDGEENTVKYSADASEENPESEGFSIVEGLETSGKIKEAETPEVCVKDLEDETAIPAEQKKDVSDAAVLDVSEATEIDDLNAPTSTKVSGHDLEAQSAFPEEQKQEKATEIQEPSSNGADNGLGYAEAVQKKEGSLEEEITRNPVETLEDKTEVVQSSTDLSADEVSSDQGRAPETVDKEKEKDKRFEIQKEAIDATAKDLNIPSKDKEVSASAERKSESLKDVDTTSMMAPKDFTTVEEPPEPMIEERKNESSNDIQIPRVTAVVKDIGSSEMVEEKKNESKDHSVLEKNVQIPDNKKNETQLEAIQIAADKSEKKKLGAEKEETQKFKDEDPNVSSDTADTKLIKEPTKLKLNNFFSKAKRSIVKAKKAIFGKSPGVRDPRLSSEIKDEIS